MKLIGGDTNLVRTKTPSKSLMFQSFSLDFVIFDYNQVAIITAFGSLVIVFGKRCGGTMKMFAVPSRETAEVPP